MIVIPVNMSNNLMDSSISGANSLFLSPFPPSPPRLWTGHPGRPAALQHRGPGQRDVRLAQLTPLGRALLVHQRREGRQGVPPMVPGGDQLPRPQDIQAWTQLQGIGVTGSERLDRSRVPAFELTFVVPRFLSAAELKAKPTKTR